MNRKVFLIFITICICQSVNGQIKNYTLAISKIGVDTLNYIPFENAKMVSITGDKYTISEHSTPDFFALNNAHDIAEINIYGDVIRISDPLHFPDSKINIYCRELIFEKNEFSDSIGSINNTPLKHFQNRAHQFENGLKGLNAKPIQITAWVVRKAFSGENVKLIISEGGPGQEPGYGRDGKQGKSYPVISCRCSGCEGAASTADATSGKPTMHYKNIIYTNACGTRGTKAWPKDGEDALAGGKPGEGGDGGDLYLNIHMHFVDDYNENGRSWNEAFFRNCFYSIEKGRTGWPAKREPYIGGKPGTPEMSRMWVKTKKGSKLIEHMSKKGNDAKNPWPQGTARDGNVYYYSEKNRTEHENGEWAHPEYIRFKYLRIVELFKNKEADDIIFFNEFMWLLTNVNLLEEKIDCEFIKIRESNIDKDFEKIDYNNDIEEFEYLSNRELNDLKSLFIKIKRLKYNYKNGLDYFGNSSDWAPMLSFEYNYTNFSNEVGIALNEIYLSEWIVSEKSSLENKMIGLIELSKVQNSKINSSKYSITEALDEIPKTQKKAFSLKHKTDLLFLKLKEIEKELKELAETTVEEKRQKAKMFKLLKTASTLLKASPVGQPYTTGVGFGIDIINEFDYSEEGWNGFNSFNSIYGDMSEIDWKQHSKSWEKYQKEYKNLDKIESLKKIYKEFYKPLENDISQFVSLLRDSKMKDSDMQNEFEKLKAENNTFKELAIEIELLSIERASLIKEIENLSNNIYDEFSQIVFRENLAGNLNFSIAKKQFVLSKSNTTLIEEIKENAISKLDYYSYLLVKSYEYRFTRPFPGNWYNTEIYKSVREILEENKNDIMITLAQTDRLRDIYLINLKKITSEIISEYNSGIFTHSTKKFISLTKEQISDLNEFGKTKLNLIDSNYFNLNQEENIRLSDINLLIDSTNFKIESKNINFGEIDVFVIHSGMSQIVKNNLIHHYSHYGPKTQSKYTWGARYSIHQNETNQIEVSPSDYSLLNTLLGDFSSLNYLNIFSRPGAMSEYQIEMTDNIHGSEDFEIKKLTLELIYDYE